MDSFVNAISFEQCRAMQLFEMMIGNVSKRSSYSHCQYCGWARSLAVKQPYVHFIVHYTCIRPIIWYIWGAESIFAQLVFWCVGQRPGKV